ncbi:LysE/ArgO family amino acid transporter [Nocardia macrotermitis]|uniref:Arginine exporter protein ArgO n=1 Tax=Nocardia macrotermitis TaxID=2585198 RepID=A0A7K0CY96_9NOCA|nr:LysE/ArgO family amino acid transporter [Nocardia macrotermitis]MQY18456.1 Arginine exporter protein ArgO [Nocardia macrotermitis]
MDTSSAVRAALSGLGFGLSLIVVIGAQNTFVLRQGIRREHVLAVVAVCAISDVVLIAAGVAGLGAIIRSAPTVLVVARYAGAVFVIGYGIMAARRALTPGTISGEPSGASVALGATLLTCLGMTWLNPNVYLDTVVLLGSFASTYAGAYRWFLAAGAMFGSIAWFTCLGFGARLLGPLFARRIAWRALDSVIALIMFTLGAVLLLQH